MPFTFAHPAAVIPVQHALRHRTILSALVIGSMAPDFQNFLPFDVDRADSHSLAGMFWFSLPVGLALYLAFHLLLKRPLSALPPPAVAARLAPFLAGPALPSASGLEIVLSLLLGTLTHLAWDALTHYSFVTADFLPALSAHLFTVGTYHVYPYKLLQHLSTVAGTLLLWRWGRQWLHRAPLPPRQLPDLLGSRARRAFIAILLGAPPLIGVARAAQSWAFSYAPLVLNDIVRETVVTAISSFGLLFLIYGMVFHALIWPRRQQASHPGRAPAAAQHGKKKAPKKSPAGAR